VKRCLYTADPALSTPTCLRLSASEVLEAAAGKGLKYLVLDVRTDDEFRSGHLPTAFHLPSRLVNSPFLIMIINQLIVNSVFIIIMYY
jgi:rhodanese-related sulfurtransferase